MFPICFTEALPYGRGWVYLRDLRRVEYNRPFHLAISGMPPPWKILVTCAILGAMPALAATSPDTDPPRRAARLGYLGGAVSLTPAGLQDSTPAEVNRPFTTGDRFWSGADGRGELQTENAAIRFGGHASFAIQELSNQATLIRLESGTLSVRLHALAPLEDFEIETPQFTFRLNRLGAYRVDAGEKGDVVIASVRVGDAEVFRGDGVPTAVARGKQARGAGGGSPAIESAPPLDPFEAWCVERDRREDLSAAAQYVSRDVPGYADLDEHGAWRSVDPYGMTWFPGNMDPDWAPYRSGHFVSAGLWGMNWVDDASWGFGPLHYGRWVKSNGAWGWVPGAAGKSGKAGAPETFAIRPYYAPALVAWTRFAAGAVRPNVVVGWFPLGPGEPWAPQFPASAGYVERVNLGNTAMGGAAGANYMNRETALTAIGQDDLAAGRPVGREFVRVPAADYARGTVAWQPGVEVTREARLGPRGPAAGAPPQIANREVVVHRAPAAAAAPAYVRQEPVRTAPPPVRRTVPQMAPQMAPQTVHRAAPQMAPPTAAMPHAVERPPAKPVTPVPAAHSGGITGALHNASKSVAKGASGAVKGAAGVVKGGTSKTTQANQSKPKPKKPPQD